MHCLLCRSVSPEDRRYSRERSFSQHSRERSYSRSPPYNGGSRSRSQSPAKGPGQSRSPSPNRDGREPARGRSPSQWAWGKTCLGYHMQDFVLILGKLLLFIVVWTLIQWNWILICCFIYQLCLLLELNMVGKSSPSWILIFETDYYFFLSSFSWILIDFASIFYLYVLVFKCGWWYVLVFKCNQLDQSLLPFSCCFAWVTTTINQTLQFLFLLCHGIKLKLALIRTLLKVYWVFVGWLESIK